MTDNEIIERLQFLLKIGDAPIGKGFGVVIDKQDIHETLELIKKQQEQIDRLTDSDKRLREGVSLMLNNENGIELIKAEAIKEFADKLKQNLSFGKYITAEQIDNLVKEMGCGE